MLHKNIFSIKVHGSVALGNDKEQRFNYVVGILPVFVFVEHLKHHRGFKRIIPPHQCVFDCLLPQKRGYRPIFNGSPHDRNTIYTLFSLVPNEVLKFDYGYIKF